MQIKIDIKVCRVCLQSSVGKSLFKDSNLMQYFTAVTMLEVIENDGLPETLCTKCVARLKVAHDFKKQSEISDLHLRAFINQVNDKFNESFRSNDEEFSEEKVNEILLTTGYMPEIKSPSTNSQLKMAAIPKQKIISSKSPLKRDEQKCLKIENESIDDETEFIKDETELIKDVGENLLEILNTDHDYGDQEQVDDPDDIKDFEEQYGQIDYIEEQLVGEAQMTDVVYAEPFDAGPRTKKKKIIAAKPNKPNTFHNCHICHKDFSVKANLVRHLDTFHGSKRYKCPICGNSFTQSGSLKHHLHIHTGERPYKCEICERGFTQGKSLALHRRIHTGEKPLKCQYCDKHFRQTGALKTHEMGVHFGIRKEKKENDRKEKKDVDQTDKQDVEIFPCEICQKVLYSKHALTMHLKKHTEVKEFTKSNGFKCNECDMTFSNLKSLANHIRMHQNPDKKFKCNNCLKEFVTKSALFFHSKQHDQSMPFKCIVCEAEFSEHQDIMVHKDEHTTSLKRYVCSICSRRFFVKHNMLKHMKEHENDNVIYRCDNCEISFSTWHLYQTHRAIEHQEIIANLFKCDDCCISFETESDLSDHHRAEHDDEMLVDDNCQEEHLTDRF